MLLMTLNASLELVTNVSLQQAQNILSRETKIEAYFPNALY
jgi:hypothetical protein